MHEDKVKLEIEHNFGEQLKSKIREGDTDWIGEVIPYLKKRNWMICKHVNVDKWSYQKIANKYRMSKQQVYNIMRANKCKK